MQLSTALGLGDRALVAFVGAGGKKTAMHRLAIEGPERGLDVGFTTTTQMPPPDLPLTVTNAERLPEALLETEPSVAFASQWVSDPERVDRKVRGFDPEPLTSVLDRGFVDWLLVKADGARRREFKAPDTNEPVVPDEATHVVPVASVRAVGEPLSETVVHRPERVAAIADLSVGDTIMPETIGTVLASPRGGLQHVPDDAAVIPVVNKADAPALQETARAVLEHALAESARFTRGLVTSFERDVCLPVKNESA
ncbi:dehydrogenase [Natrinema saccharevitans]|uniref:Dehydrogenase n=1 Tax=Natrinema saccharevitans TaxID=301967 RepID=A0A1S8ARS9_9EURY|nr:selenium cofactor biosynthesis protein YqeC [Natrinema saccharevitans]OLZ39380.1 dehydrogenase [Natrinema saccharevitans]